ncbi:alpha-1,3-rhamnosyl/mannosyltransferase [Prosthecobacter fusiformis]|uniref:Alpha-1,3-rhamnosyl/mannosyltransferase n=2 Tax=Prosthecobacter fusiformis TaxID=48464 RepID=A0A4R7S4Y7_9BACT|nr:alpha-1,3-rhamnosyl/mannosyltransferase [Prosthecobacter fusiformis]
MGWVSMNRYWQALVTESKSDAGVRSLFPAGPVETPAKSRWQRLWLRRVAYPWMIKTQVRSGVLHILDHSFADLLSSVRPAVRTVVTVHDLIPLSDPADLTSSQWMRYQKTVSWIPRADKVVCVSNHTRQEVQWLLNVSEDKLHVLPNGTSQLPFPDAVMSERLAILPPFILSVGGTRPRKNLRLLVPLTQCLAERGSRVTVVRAGPALDESLAARIREHAELHELGMVSDAELAAAYGRAALTLVPSTHEGFGLPVLEAMQAGCPVVYSQATSLPEVAGEAGLSFDPDDPTRAADLCWRVLSEPDLRQQLIKAGRARANQFTWSAHWRGLREIYDGLLNS